MAKKSYQGPCEPAARQRIPSGHWDEEGRSQGDRIGEGRKTHDAWQDRSEERKEEKGGNAR